MAMSYGIIRVQKFKRTAVHGIQIHDKREKESRTNPDIDRDRTPNNYTLQHCENLSDEVQKRIQSLNLKRSVRKDAVVMCQALITSDHNFFKDLDTETQSKFFMESFEFLQKKFDKYNILSATIHLDEKTPHMHVNFVPVVNGKLSAKELLTPDYLRELQTDFYNEIGKRFGLERGEPRAEKVKHLETEIYKIETRKEKLKELENSLMGDKGFINAEDVKAQGALLKKETPEEIAQRLEKKYVRPHLLRNQVLEDEIKEKDKEISKLTSENRILRRKELGYDNLMKDFNYLLDYRDLSAKSKTQLKEIAHVFSIRDEYDRRTQGQKKGEYNPIYGTFADYLKSAREKEKEKKENKIPLGERLFKEFEENNKQKYNQEFEVLKISNFNRSEFENKKEKLTKKYEINDENYLKFLLEKKDNSKEFLEIVEKQEKKIKTKQESEHKKQQEKIKQIKKSVSKGLMR